MIHTPTAIGMMLCDQVIVEKGTNKPSAIGIFATIAVPAFPSDPVRFSVLAALTDGVGDGRIEVVVTRLGTDERIYSYRNRIRFPYRLAVVNALFRVTKIRFPAPGFYEVALVVDGDVVAHRRVKVHRPEALP